MKIDKLLEKYTIEELAESFVFRTKLTAKEKAESNMQLTEMRKKIQQEMTPKERLLGISLQLKYQSEYVKVFKNYLKHL